MKSASGEPERSGFLLSVVADKFPNQPALIAPGRLRTYRELDRITSQAAERLKREGLKTGDRLAIFSSNSPQYVTLLWAAWRMGIVVVPFSTRWPAPQIARELKEMGCTALALSREFRSFPAVSGIRCLALEEMVPVNSSASFSDIRVLPKTNLQQDATILFTSGSSGKPKAVLHSLENHYYSALGSNRNIRVLPGDRWLLSLPLYHVGGLAILFRTVLAGAAVVVPAGEAPMEETIRKTEITHLSLVSTQLYRLLQNSSLLPRLRRMKAILLGGSAIPPLLIRQAAENGLPVFTSYGSTEMASQITTTRPGDSPERLLTSGKILPYREVKIAPDGEILVRGKTLFRGYLKGNRLYPARTSNGWFHTGDVGRLDEHGYLHVIGRKDNMFISGGENIQPEAIEQRLKQINGVTDAVVVPVPHPEYGHRPAAFLKTEDGTLPDLSAVTSTLREQLPRFMIPDYFFPWPERTDPSEMKISRREFRQIAEKMVGNNSDNISSI